MNSNRNETGNEGQDEPLEPLTWAEHVEVNRLMVSFLEAAWRGDDETGALILENLTERERIAAMGSLAGIARQALATTGPPAVFLTACRELLESEGGR